MYCLIKLLRDNCKKNVILELETKTREP